LATAVGFLNELITQISKINRFLFSPIRESRSLFTNFLSVSLRLAHSPAHFFRTTKISNSKKASNILKKYFISQIYNIHLNLLCSTKIVLLLIYTDFR